MLLYCNSKVTSTEYISGSQMFSHQLTQIRPQTLVFDYFLSPPPTSDENFAVLLQEVHEAHDQNSHTFLSLCLIVVAAGDLLMCAQGKQGGPFMALCDKCCTVCTELRVVEIWN